LKIVLIDRPKKEADLKGSYGFARMISPERNESDYPEKLKIGPQITRMFGY
jgi:hypothetical protein